jgi:hypothetical protein
MPSTFSKQINPYNLIVRKLYTRRRILQIFGVIGAGIAIGGVAKYFMGREVKPVQPTPTQTPTQPPPLTPSPTASLTPQPTSTPTPNPEELEIKTLYEKYKEILTKKFPLLYMLLTKEENQIKIENVEAVIYYFFIKQYTNGQKK